MSPLQVETSREVFNAIVPHLFDLYKQDTPSGTLWERIRQADASQPELEAIRTLADQTLIYTESGNWSVQRFFSTFNTGRYPLRADGSMQDFSLRFSDIVALVVRDDVFLELAARENLHERAEVQRDIRRWQDKWVYHQTRDRMLDTLRFDQEVVTEFVTGIQSPYSDRIKSRLTRDLVGGKPPSFSPGLPRPVVDRCRCVAQRPLSGLYQRNHAGYPDFE